MEYRIGLEIDSKIAGGFLLDHPTSYGDTDYLWRFEKNPMNVNLKTINKNKILDLFTYGNAIFEFGYRPKSVVLSGLFSDDTYKKEHYYDSLAYYTCGMGRSQYGEEITGERKFYMDEFYSGDNGQLFDPSPFTYKKRFMWVFGGWITETRVGERDSNVLDWQVEMIAIDPFKYSDEMVGNTQTYIGTDDYGTIDHLKDDQANFTDTLDNFLVRNTSNGTWARITNWNSSTDLTLSSDIMNSGESYYIGLGVVVSDASENTWSSLNGAVVYNGGSAFTEPIWKIWNTGATDITKVEIGDTALDNCDNLRYNKITYNGTIPQNQALYLKPRTTKDFNYYLLNVGWNTNTDTVYTTKNITGRMPRMYPAETLDNKTIKLTGCTSAVVNCYYRHAFI